MSETVWSETPQSLDQQVRSQLKKWPQRPPGVVASPKQPGTWLRGRPGDLAATNQPFLKLPGSNRVWTLPDGLWLHFSPDFVDPFVDILCIEACSSLQNLLDKRSRFAPTASSLMAYCPLDWLLGPAQPNDRTPRWRLIRMVKDEPVQALILPVRDVRVVFGLKSRHYEGFARNQVAQAHEILCPMEALIAEHGYKDPNMRSLISRASATANFMLLP